MRRRGGENRAGRSPPQPERVARMRVRKQDGMGRPPSHPTQASPRRNRSSLGSGYGGAASCGGDGRARRPRCCRACPGTRVSRNTAGPALPQQVVPPRREPGRLGEITSEEAPQIAVPRLGLHVAERVDDDDPHSRARPRELRETIGLAQGERAVVTVVREVERAVRSSNPCRPGESRAIRSRSPGGIRAMSPRT